MPGSKPDETIRQQARECLLAAEQAGEQISIEELRRRTGVCPKVCAEVYREIKGLPDRTAPYIRSLPANYRIWLKRMTRDLKRGDVDILIDALELWHMVEDRKKPGLLEPPPRRTGVPG